MFKVMDLINALSKLGSVVENVDKLMEQVRKQKLKSDQLRAGVEIERAREVRAECGERIEEGAANEVGAGAHV